MEPSADITNKTKNDSIKLNVTVINKKLEKKRVGESQAAMEVDNGINGTGGLVAKISQKQIRLSSGERD